MSSLQERLFAARALRGVQKQEMDARSIRPVKIPTQRQKPVAAPAHAHA